MAILLLAFAELQAALPDAVIHGLFIALILGRLIHAYGVSQVEENYRFRVCGMILTFMPILTVSLALIVNCI